MATNGMSLLFRLPATLRPAAYRTAQGRAKSQLSSLAPSNANQCRTFTTNAPRLGSTPDRATDCDACTAALQSNRKWAQDATTKDPELFDKLSKGQSPRSYGSAALTPAAPRPLSSVSNRVMSSCTATSPTSSTRET